MFFVKNAKNTPELFSNGPNKTIFDTDSNFSPRSVEHDVTLTAELSGHRKIYLDSMCEIDEGRDIHSSVETSAFAFELAEDKWRGEGHPPSHRGAG